MTAPTTTDTGPGRWAPFLRGAVDLYVHAGPDVIERHGDDLDLGRDLAPLDLRAAVHRHHFSPTAVRAALATAVTGAPLLGAILTNQSAGGLDPLPVQLALRYGARWVGMPTTSARHYRRRAAAQGRLTDHRTFGTDDLAVLDEQGALREPVAEIIALAAAAQAPLNLGYLSAAECVLVGRQAARSGTTTVLTNPLGVIGLTVDETLAVLDATGARLEVTGFSLFRADADAVDAVAALIRAAGVQRCALSSDSGIASAPRTGALYARALDTLSAAGFTDAELRTITHDVPARILGL